MKMNITSAGMYKLVKFRANRVCIDHNAFRLEFALLKNDDLRIISFALRLNKTNKKMYL